MNYKLEFLNSELRKIISNDAKTIDILVAKVDGQRGEKNGKSNLLKIECFCIAEALSTCRFLLISIIT